MMQNLKRNWLVVSKLARWIWGIFTWTFTSLKKLHFNGLLLNKLFYVWVKNVQRSYVSWQRRVKQIFFCFSIWIFIHDHSRTTGLQGKGDGISLTPHYHFHPLHRHLDISRVITAESSPLHIGSSRTRTFGFQAQVANQLWFGK